MTSPSHEALEIIEKLNDKFESLNGLNHYVPFSFESSVHMDSVIYFMGVPVWSEENDPHDNLEKFILNESSKILKDLYSRSFTVLNPNWLENV